MKDRRSQLKNRVVSEALGWYYRQPFPLYEWFKNPDALLANLKRIDDACAALVAERKRIKDKSRPQPQ